MNEKKTIGQKTIGNYWPYATTVFDYIRRAMPPSGTGQPDRCRGLCADRLVAVSECDSSLDDTEMNAGTLPLVTMPALERFVPDDRHGGAEVR